MSDPSHSVYGGNETPIPGDESPDAAFDALAARRRREILSVLADRRSRISEADLASHVVAREAEKPLRDVRDEEHRRVHASMHHAHLPKLAAAGLVARGDRGVTATGHPLYCAPEFDAMLRREETDPDATDAALRALADERRRAMLAVLSKAGSLTETELAERVAHGDALGGSDSRSSTESAGSAGSARASDDELARLLASFRHAHLPTLARAGLVRRDPETRTVTYEGHPAIEDHWFERPFGRSASATVGRDGEVWTLDGRERVLARSREVCASADERLDVVLPPGDRLADACLAGFRAAAERGAAVSVGSRSAAVRSLVRERVPGATVWEPRLDPVSGGDALGRLVLADGESVVLGSLAAGDADARETGVTGEGANNPLVVLLRRLLDPRAGSPAEAAFRGVSL